MHVSAISLTSKTLGLAHIAPGMHGDAVQAKKVPKGRQMLARYLSAGDSISATKPMPWSGS